MLKVKLKLSHTVALLVRDCLYDAAEVKGKDHLEKMFANLWLEVYLKMEAKTLFLYEGEKKFSMSIAHGIALMKLLQKWNGNHLTNATVVDNFRYVTFQSIIASIDQQTA